MGQVGADEFQEEFVGFEKSRGFFEGFEDFTPGLDLLAEFGQHPGQAIVGVGGVGFVEDRQGLISGQSVGVLAEVLGGPGEGPDEAPGSMG